MTIPDPADGSSPAFIGVAPLMRRAFAGENLFPLGETLLARAQADAGDAHAYFDLSTVLQLTGNRVNALAVQAEAVALQRFYQIPAARGPALRLLVVMGLGDLMGNTPIEFLVEDSDVALDLLYLTMDADFPEDVPDHDVLMVAVAESDANQPLLARLADYVHDWPRPVINRPERIAQLSREGVCEALAGVPGMLLPPTVRVERDAIAGLADGTLGLHAFLPGAHYPVIVRPVGSHAGTGLEKIDCAADFAGYLEWLPDARFHLSPFVDYRSSDGQFRKLRVALVDGQPFICHLAISDHWMIHYLNAGMTDSAVKRDEEAAGMAGFDDGFAQRHGAALRAIDARLGLPYIGLDCAETMNGQLLVFEVDNAMLVHAMDPVDLFPYKKPIMDRLFSAFRQMLERRRQG